MLHLADWFFVISHTSLILFNSLGWLLQKTRRLNLITLILTGLSWTVLGIWYGFGYCPLTDFHFDVLHRLGEANLPGSYIEYLAERLTGFDFSSGLANRATAIVFAAALVASVFLNVKNLRRKK